MRFYLSSLPHHSCLYHAFVPLPRERVAERTARGRPSPEATPAPATGLAARVSVRQRRSQREQGHRSIHIVDLVNLDLLLSPSFLLQALLAKEKATHLGFSPPRSIMSESLVYKGSLEGHGGWVTAIATSSENPDMILTASRGASLRVDMECIGGKGFGREEGGTG
jgi:hypothetical protein